MRRLLRSMSVAVLLAVAVTTLAGMPSASAAGPITGRLVDGSTGDPVAGMTVRLLRTAADGSPGALVASDVTTSTGRFELPTASAPGEDEFWVKVEPGDHMGGWIGAGAVQAVRGNASTHGSGTALGQVLATPSFVQGVMVDAITGDRVAGVVVTVRDATSLSTVLGRDRTGSRGVFTVTGLHGDDDSFGLRLNGSPVSYESGWRSCSAEVVPTWGAACGSPLGSIGSIAIEAR